MASIEPTDAHYSVPIENSLQNFFAFQFQENFTDMHFYLMVSPVLYTLRKLGYNVMNYLDDIFIW